MYWPDEIEGDCCWYWSSSSVKGIDVFAFFVSFDYGFVYCHDFYYAAHVRCARSP
jgi:hypothetical protein